ncbi:MAG TPA: PIN domain-containing protein [Solirubrobacteraceae bacterium]
MATRAAHPLRDPCRQLISAVANRDLEATTTVEAIQEFLHVRARRRGRADAVQLANDYVDLFSPLLAVSDEHLRQGLSIFKHSERLGAFDAVLAAAALSTGAQALMSADTAFAEVPSLRHIVPDAAGVASILQEESAS